MTNLFKTDSIALDPRAHMKISKDDAVVIPPKKQAVPDIVWHSYYHLRSKFAESFTTGSLPELRASVDTQKKTTLISGREVPRMQHLDDFSEMVRREDADSHVKLDAYVSPIAPSCRMDWLKAVALATMIDNGRIGIKEKSSGYRAVYAYRSRTGNPFFRIFGGRTSIIIAVLQWFLFMGIFVLGIDLADSYGVDSFFWGMVGLTAVLGFFFLYNIIHWKFHKRYAFILNYMIVDGWKDRNMPSASDSKWATGRMAGHAINAAGFLSGMIITVFLAVKDAGVV